MAAYDRFFAKRVFGGDHFRRRIGPPGIPRVRSSLLITLALREPIHFDAIALSQGLRRSNRPGHPGGTVDQNYERSHPITERHSDEMNRKSSRLYSPVRERTL